MNIERIKVQVNNAIKKKPTHIKIYRKTKSEDGMSAPKEVIFGVMDTTELLVGEIDVFFNDSNRGYVSNKYSDSGVSTKVRSISILAVPGFEICEDDYFYIKENKYIVIYSGQIIDGVYECDLEAIK